MQSPAPRKAWFQILYVQVLIAVALGILVGYLFPDDVNSYFVRWLHGLIQHFFPKLNPDSWHASALKPLADGFIRLIKMIIAPIVFCTIVHGLASMSDVKKLGRVGLKTIIYFEVVSTIALLIGLVVVNLLQPGAGFNFDLSKVDAKTAQDYAAKAHSLSIADFLLNIIPTSFFDAFAKGDLLQVLMLAILTSFALKALGDRAPRVLHAIETAGQLFFGIMAIVVKVAPLGAFGAMAFTVGSYGIGSLTQLLKLMGGFYLTATLFVLVVLGAIARFAGFSIFRFLAYIKEELLLVLGTSSSETALPGMIQKMQRLGCADGTVGLVIPTGYSFNLDGTNIYMTMAAIFLAQATNTHLTIWQQLWLLFIAMISSKGASGVTGAGFITLAATLAAVPDIPIASMALLVGIDRFMSECRAITNLIGNGVATVVVSRWEKEVTAEHVRAQLDNRS
jgi:aerobic C4-dicarboxylate transport protein